MKTKKSSFVEGTFISTISIIITKIIGILYIIPFYHLIGSKGSTLFAYTYAIYAIFLDISTSGIPIAISKIVNEYDTLNLNEEKQNTYHIGLRIMITISIISFIILFIFSKNISHILIGNLNGNIKINELANALKIVSISLLIIPFLSITRGYLQGHHILNITGLSQVIEQLIRVSSLLIITFIFIKVLKTSQKLAIIISFLSIPFSILIAYLFLFNHLKKDNLIKITNKYKKDKSILKKIIIYSIPFIIINIINSLYNFIDLTIIIKVLKYFKITPSNIEYISSTISTWSNKINIIVTSIAIGMTTSLIPTIVSLNTKNDQVNLNYRFNQALQIVLFISIPMTVGISFLARPIWHIFYDNNIIGSNILSLNIYIALLTNLFMVSSTFLQGINDFKTIYLSTIIGFTINAILDAPIMFILSYLNIKIYYGTIISSIIGFLVSIIIILIRVKNIYHINYQKTIKILFKIIIITITMYIYLNWYKYIFIFDLNSKISCLIYIIIEILVGILIYFSLSLITGIFFEIFGIDYNLLIKKLIHKKISH